MVYTTLHYDTPWSYESYLKTGGYAALRKILEEKISPEQVIEITEIPFGTVTCVLPIRQDGGR